MFHLPQSRPECLAGWYQSDIIQMAVPSDIISLGIADSTLQPAPDGVFTPGTKLIPKPSRKVSESLRLCPSEMEVQNTSPSYCWCCCRAVKQDRSSLRIPSPDKVFFYKETQQQKLNTLLQIPGVGGGGFTSLTERDEHIHTWTRSQALFGLFWETPQLLCGVHAKAWLLHGEQSSWHQCSWRSSKMHVAVHQRRILVLLLGWAPWLCWAVGALQQTAKLQPVFTLLSSSWRSKVWLLRSTGASLELELPRTGWSHVPHPNPEEQSSRKSVTAGRRDCKGEWRNRGSDHPVARIFPYKHQTLEWFTIFSLLQALVILMWNASN